MKTRALYALLALAFAVQTVHHAEHVTQLIQIYALGFKPPEAHGLLGSVFDFEWVHFIYNVGLEVTLVGLWLGYRRARRGDPSGVSHRGPTLLTALVLFQGYHSVEHVVKLYQYLFVPYYQFGLRPPPGFLPHATGWPIFLVHFWLNMIVWAAMVAVLWALRPRGVIREAMAALDRLPLPTALAGLTAILALGGGLTLGGVALYQHTHTLHVPGDYATIQAAIDAAPRTATILVAPGEYAGPITIHQSLILRAEQPGATRLVGADADAVIHIYGAQDVTIEGFVIQGGRYGVLVEESEAVRLADNRIVGAWLAGVRLSRAQARLVGNEVRDTRSPYGIGIELANTHSRPESVMVHNTVSGHARQGILLHNAEAEVIGNWVIGNDLRGIAITEMSTATVRGNTLVNNADAGLYVVDMSVVEAEDNHIADMRPGPLGWAHAIRVEYYAEATLKRNRVDGETDRLVVWHQGVVEGDVSP